MSFNVLRPHVVSRTGLGMMSLRQLSTSRAVAVQASRRACAAEGITAEDTVGFKYVPGGPILPGTVNDATKFPPPDRTHGSYHWAFERVLSAALIPLTVGAAVTSGTAHPILDGILGVSLVVHSHIGFDSAVVDYFHPRKFPVLGQVMSWLLRICTGLSVWGVYEFNTNDIGITEFVRRVWKA
ncbi:hypothetical protein QFC20_000558 [Naganishia adeliensis]|uniref:Uncharacterized protein n=1 Tax=Naganishia adeliensis TaxID=92952 RepID=A0ACC2WZR3_9TREE|nr:hypothetical protein QFC20_000558 [Naganishia adeliensis]